MIKCYLIHFGRPIGLSPKIYTKRPTNVENLDWDINPYGADILEFKSKTKAQAYLNNYHKEHCIACRKRKSEADKRYMQCTKARCIFEGDRDV
jgi:hypothetical protein